MRDNDLRRRGARGTLLLAVTGLTLGVAPGCDFLDPTGVDNPQTTTEDLANAARPTEALLPGLRAQFARALRAVVVTAETVSDNYSIESTGLSKEVDDPYRINPSVGMINGTGVTGAYFNLQELRALADFVIDEIIPKDETDTPALRAEAHFLRGMAYLMQGENFIAVPTEANGVPMPGKELLQRAVANFQAVLAEDPQGEFVLRVRAALARTHRALGNAAEAASHAQAALARDPDFVFAQDYDPSYLENGPYFFLVSRATQEMQPLPRLDFLDPKYTTADAAIPYLKAEEMHLILGEVALAAGNEELAADRVAEAVELAKTRTTFLYFDEDDRKNADLTLRPRDSEFLVRSAADQPFRAGLVLGEGMRAGKRGKVEISTISNTSLDADSVRSLSQTTTVAHALFLARQEILFLEGRRLSDLGIRLPISQREIDASPTLKNGNPGTVVFVPAWIPRNGGLDAFAPKSPYVDSKGKAVTTNEITILNDLNRILADNFVEASPF